MREIKFRAWDKEECKMYNSKDIQVFLNNEFSIDAYIIDEHRLLCRPILMQYTGIKDINGIDIYEGDLLQIKSFKVNEKEISMESVIYSEFEGMYITSKGYILGRINDRVEVIGNIYENPELLGE